MTVPLWLALFGAGVFGLLGLILGLMLRDMDHNDGRGI